jgi:hypothetical protein
MLKELESPYNNLSKVRFRDFVVRVILALTALVSITESLSDGVIKQIDRPGPTYQLPHPPDTGDFLVNSLK